ncbi:MAG: hypothetical protein ACNYPE_16635 [Candidatus Azotimanducaceae bacterium WSBS_2022_MAG_OTU7]
MVPFTETVYRVKRSSFPDTEFPVVGAKLLLGVLAKLQGAESQQIKLSSIELTPHIEKHLDVTGTLYTAALGPRRGPANVAKAKENDLMIILMGRE